MTVAVDTPSMRWRNVSSVAAAVTSTVLAVTPASLIGGLAVLMRSDLGLDEARLGLAVGIFFGASAVGSIPGGWLCEHLGPRRSLLGGITATVAIMIAIATLAHTWIVLVLLSALAGIANAVTQPAANLALAAGVTSTRHGLVFGIKQSAVPVASLLSGVAVPALGLTFGWRWAFVAYLGLAVPAYLFSGRVPARSRAGGPNEDARPRVTSRLWRLVVLSAGTGLGAAGANSLTGFLVASLVADGSAPDIAGLLLALGSGVGVGARLLVGWLADRRPGGGPQTVAAMLLLGAVGFVLLGVVNPGMPVVLGVLLAFGAGWGWPGLFLFVVVRENMNAPAAATGITQAGTWAGGMLGPLVFGLIAGRFSYDAAWLTAAGWLAAGAALLCAGAAIRGPRRTPAVDA